MGCNRPKRSYVIKHETAANHFCHGICDGFFNLITANYQQRSIRLQDLHSDFITVVHERQTWKCKFKSACKLELILIKAVCRTYRIMICR